MCAGSVTGRVGQLVRWAGVCVCVAGLMAAAADPLFAGSKEQQLLSSLAPPSVANPSFEDNAAAFVTFPGYVNSGANPTIASWTSNNNSSGINPGNGAGSPFANNGVIPDGANVAFLQSNVGNTTTLSQVISGFEAPPVFDIAGLYEVTFRYNSRSGGTPNLEVTIGDGVNTQSIFTHNGIAPVGGANPYYVGASSPFFATAESMTLTFISTANADETVLLDLVSINQLAPGVILLTPEPGTFVLFGACAVMLGGVY